MTKSKSTIHGALLVGVSSLVFMVTSYGVNLWLGRFLGPSGYGTYGVVISLMTAINIIQTSGLPQATSKFLAEDRHDSNAILRSGLRAQIVLTFILTGLFFLLAKPLATLLKDQLLTPYIQAASLILPFYGICQLYESYYNGLHDFKRQAFTDITYSVSKLVSVITLVYFLGLYGAIAGFIISPIVALLYGFKLPKKTSAYFPVSKIVRFGLPLIGFVILSTLLISVDLFFVKALVPNTEMVGFYTANQNVARIPYYAMGAFALVLFPSISKAISQGLHDKAKIMVTTALRYLLLFLIPGTALISATSSQILQLLYSHNYAAGAQSLSILVIGLALLSIFVVLANVISGAGKPHVSMWLAAVSVGITSVACYFLIPRFGLSGAAWATSIGGGVSFFSALFYVYKLIGATIPITSLIRISVASAIIASLAHIIHVPLVVLPILYIVFLFFYIALLLITKEITRTDINTARSLIPRWVPYIHQVE